MSSIKKSVLFHFPTLPRSSSSTYNMSLCNSFRYAQSGIWASHRTTLPDRDTEFIQQRILISLQKQEATASLRFLCLLSYLHFHDIPDVLWTTDPKFQDEVLRPLLQNEASLELILKPLVASSAVYRSTLAKWISIDPSAQNAMRALVEAKTPDSDGVLRFLTGDERSPQYWIKRAIEVVNIAYPTPSQNKPVEHEALNFHAIRCIQFGQWYRIVTADLEELRHSFSYRLCRQGLNLLSSEAFLKAQEQGFEVGNVNRVPLTQGSLPECSPDENYHQDLNSLDPLERILQLAFGVHEFAPVAASPNLAGMFYATGRFPDANSHYEVERSINEQCLNAESPMLSETLGEACDDLAIYCFPQAWSIGKTGAREMCTRMTEEVENMAQSYTESRQFASAIELYRSVLELKRALFGIDHVNTADTVNDMGVALQQMREYEEAVSCFKQALRIYKSKSPQDIDPTKLANTLRNLGIVYSEQGNQALATGYFRQALTFSNSDVALKGTINNLGVAFARKGLLDEAIALYKYALKMARTSPGCHDLDVADILYNIGVTEVNVGRRKSAKNHLRQSNRIFNNCLGERHFKSMRTVNLLRMLQQRKRLRKPRKSRK